MSSDQAELSFGTLNWVTLAAYLAVLVTIGIRCSRRESSIENYFLGGRRIPWWAAGLSLFSTVLSAITYLSMPARAYATDWTLLPVNLCVLAVAPLVVFKYLPVLRRHAITTVYEFLAIRFDRSLQLFGSASFILFQLGRMGIVLLLPALALSAVTGINLYLCIALMGLLSTLYTVLGGIEAVVWTDVLQTGVLLGGAIFALTIICQGLEHGVTDLFKIASETGKFHWVNLETSLVGESLLVVVLGGLFSNALVPYTSDQTVVQRYLTTSDEAAARRSLWLGAVMVLPATLLFLLLGTGLFVYFQQHPDRLISLDSVDQILPWFVASQMPAGLAGLVIAGVFAAAMSSLDSSMHSIATSVVTDWLKPRSRAKQENEWLSTARSITFIAGVFGTLTAMVLAGSEITYLWDFFLGLLGLLGGTLAGVMAVAVFLPSASSQHVWAGILVSVGLLVGLKCFTPIHSLLFGFVGIMTVLLVASTLVKLPFRTDR
jgi:SSS family transporter